MDNMNKLAIFIISFVAAVFMFCFGMTIGKDIMFKKAYDARVAKKVLDSKPVKQKLFLETLKKTRSN